MEIKAITGFQDILPDRAALFSKLEAAAREIFSRYGYNEIRLPEMEFTDLFSRSIGQATDIVEKEMFSLSDSKGRSMSLRPEGTAGVVRALIENGLANQDPQARLFYMGAMFRHERPQKGRFRQFHQIGAEAFGSGDALLDAEVMTMLSDILSAAGLSGIRLEINSIGDAESRTRYKEALVAYFSAHKSSLCPDCLRRLETNPMRLLDCKVETCAAIAAQAPAILGYLNEECKKHFDDVRRYLDSAKTEYFINERIVRGLDYYTRTAFEMTTDKLGAQSAVAGGGRYDGLVQMLGGPAIPGIGFAVGVERVVELMALSNSATERRLDLMLIPLGEAARSLCVRSTHQMRNRGFRCQVALDGKSVKSAMKRADKLSARYVVVIGDDEMAKQVFVVKDMGADRPCAPDITPEMIQAELVAALVKS